MQVPDPRGFLDATSNDNIDNNTALAHEWAVWSKPTWDLRTPTSRIFVKFVCNNYFLNINRAYDYRSTAVHDALTEWHVHRSGPHKLNIVLEISNVTPEKTLVASAFPL